MEDTREPNGVTPLSAPELIELLQQRWQASYDLQLVQRRGRLYFQVMWGYQEQQSFPLSRDDYEHHIAELVLVLNSLGVQNDVRSWLQACTDRPRLGKALSLPLDLPPGRASEFVL